LVSLDEGLRHLIVASIKEQVSRLLFWFPSMRDCAIPSSPLQKSGQQPALFSWVSLDEGLRHPIVASTKEQVSRLLFWFSSWRETGAKF
jgi:hypothetical protein